MEPTQTPNPTDPLRGFKSFPWMDRALNPETSTDKVMNVLSMIDLVLVMSVNPGFGGQKFIYSQVEKVKTIKRMIGDRPIHIEIDGGITPKTAPIMVAAGADILVAGSRVFNGGSVENPEIYGRNINLIKESVTTNL